MKAQPNAGRANDQLPRDEGLSKSSRSLMKLSWIAQQGKGRLLRDPFGLDEPRDIAFRRTILSIPIGKVSTYGSVAAAAGYRRYHRAVARLLRTDPPDHLPWHRVLGAGGEIKLRGAAAREQRARLKLEGIKFKGARVHMERFEHSFTPPDVFG